MMSQTKRNCTPRINNGPTDFGGDRPSTRELEITNGNLEIGYAGVIRNGWEKTCSREDQNEKVYGGWHRGPRRIVRLVDARGRLFRFVAGALPVINNQIVAGNIETETRPEHDVTHGNTKNAGEKSNGSVTTCLKDDDEKETKDYGGWHRGPRRIVRLVDARGRLFRFAAGALPVVDDPVVAGKTETESRPEHDVTNGNTKIACAGAKTNDSDTTCSKNDENHYGGWHRGPRRIVRLVDARGRLFRFAAGALPVVDDQVVAGKIENETHAKPVESDGGERRQRGDDTLLQTTKPDPEPSTTARTTLKFWRRRYTLFTRFDLGVLIDEVGFYSVCPEILAEHMAHRSAIGTVVDPFCGVGGNVIQLAMAGRSVIAIDCDPVKIAMDRKNARIYGVEHLIDFRIGDAFRVMSDLRADAVVTSPPWGGPKYAWRKKFDARDLCSREDGGMAAVLRHCRRVAPTVILHVPKNIDREQSIQIAREAGFSGPAEIELVSVDGRPNCINLYLKGRKGHPSPSVVTTTVKLKSFCMYRECEKRYDNIADYQKYLMRVSKIVADDLQN